MNKISKQIILVLGILICTFYAVCQEDTTANKNKEIEYKIGVFYSGGKWKAYQWRYTDGSDSWQFVGQWYKGIYPAFSKYKETTLLYNKLRTMAVCGDVISIPMFLGGFMSFVRLELKASAASNDIFNSQAQINSDHYKKLAYASLGVGVIGCITYFTVGQISVVKFKKACSVYNGIARKETSANYKLKLGLASNNMSYYPSLAVRLSW